MRVTNSMVMSATLTDLNRSLGRLQDSQTTLSSGRILRRPSDDPAGASSAMLLRSQIRRSEQHGSARDDAAGWLGAADNVLVAGMDIMSRVKSIAVAAGNTGAAGDAQTRQPLAQEIGHLREELLSIANTQHLGRPVFGGTSGGDAYDAAGVYLGDGATIQREIAAGTTITVNIGGQAVFGDQTAPEGDLFAILERMQTAILAGDTAALATEHARFDDKATQFSSAAADIGSRAARVERVATRAELTEQNLREALSQIEDSDYAEALISVQASENAYNAALSAAAKVIPPSLLDFMR